MKKTLKELYREHEGKLSDKWSLYLNEFERLFAPYRDDPITLLEIGIQNGGSLELWSKYFPKATKIIGCDIDPKCAELRYRSPRIAVVVGNANSDESEHEILGQASTFDILIDDGSHTSGDIVRSFARYFPHLSEDGVYVAEDLHSSYWKDFEGGLHNPLSAMSFFKRLADILNQEHWRTPTSDREWVAPFAREYSASFERLEFSTIHSIEFMNSLCVIKKASSEKNILGKRVIVGKHEEVTSGVRKYDGTLIQEMQVNVQDDENLDVFKLIEQRDDLLQSIQDLGMFELIEQRDALLQSIQNLEARLVEQVQQAAEKERSNQELAARLSQARSDLEQLKAEVLRYTLSRSWRFTRPARRVLQWLGRRKSAS